MTLPVNPFKSGDTAPKPERPDAILVIKFAGSFSLMGLAIAGLLSYVKAEPSTVHDITMLVAASMGGLVALLASTKPTIPYPTGTTDNPIAVQGTTKPDATPVNTTEEQMQ